MIRLKDINTENNQSVFSEIKNRLLSTLKQFEQQQLTESVIEQIKFEVIKIFDEYFTDESTELIGINLAVNERGGLTFSPANDETAKLFQQIFGENTSV